MEGYKIFCEAIKALNDRIWYYNYTHGKECEQTKFLEETKMRFIDLYLLDKEAEFAIISAGTGNKQTIKFGLITVELTLDENGNQVFIYIDLENGKLCLGDDGGFPNLESVILNNNKIKSDFLIKKTLPIDEVSKILAIPSVALEGAKDYFTVLEYLRNNYNKTLPILMESSIKR